MLDTINNDIVTWYKIKDILKKKLGIQTLSLQNIIVYCVVQQVPTLMTMYLPISWIHLYIFPTIYHILQSSLVLVHTKDVYGY